MLYLWYNLFLAKLQDQQPAAIAGEPVFGKEGAMRLALDNMFSFIPPELGAIFLSFMTSLAIVLLSALVFLLAARCCGRLIGYLARRSHFSWSGRLLHHGFVRGLAILLSGMAALALSGWWLPPAGAAYSVLRLLAHLWLLLAGVMLIFSVINLLVEQYNRRPFANQVPISGFAQGLKLVILLVVLVVAISLMMGKSPTLLVSGIGAMTAVLMLVFRDPILGFVAGIQLSANRMLAVGDWLEMPKYQADGDVIEINLTTVKVRNWDQTITTVPTYALIADSFKNWRGMQEAGGRRIMRSVFIDLNTVRFLDEGDIERLRRAQLISAYIERKLREIEESNRENGIDPSSPVNGRHLTNLGTFRAYLQAYLKANPDINQKLIMMVRQLQPTPAGLPIEVYAFTKSTAWVTYEGVQADFFDHVFAVLPEFGLRVFQSPAGADLRQLQVTTSAPGN